MHFGSKKKRIANNKVHIISIIYMINQTKYQSQQPPPKEVG